MCWIMAPPFLLPPACGTPNQEVIMATGTSIVGTWNAYVDWGCDGSPVFASVFTFNADGSWTYQYGGGRWIQVEGMCFFNFTSPAGLVYTANVTRNAMVGIMGYATTSPSSGCWYATRTGAPSAALAADVQSSAKAKPGAGEDAVVGPKKK